MKPRLITVGSLVRHVPTGRIGLVIEHTMWDGSRGAFRVRFNHVTPQHCNETLLDRGDRWELIS